MSWETLNWAGKQRTDNVAMQCTLFVIANAADPDGVAFRWWPHPHHWWTYLCERTGLAHGSIYRVLKRLEEAGLIERETGPSARGRHEPLIRLRLDQFYVASKSPSETVAEEPEAPDQSPSETLESPTEIPGKTPSLPERLNESPSETPHIMSPVLNPSPNPKPLPPEQAPASEASPPNGAEGEASPSQSPPEVVDSPHSPEMQKLWTKFCAHYPEGVLDLDKAEAAFRKLPLSEASDCVHGVELYADRCKRVRQQKPMRAHLFIRKRTWAGLLATKPTTGKILAFSLIPIASQAGFALANLYRMTHPGDPVDCHDQHGNKCYSVPAPVTPQVVALADVPRHSRWEFYELHMPNCAAWRRFVEGYTGKRLAVTTRPGSARPGIYAPHPWPPRIDGTWSESPESPPSTGPPSVPKIPELTEDDIDVLTDALG